MNDTNGASDVFYSEAGLKKTVYAYHKWWMADNFWTLWKEDFAKQIKSMYNKTVIFI